MIKVYAREGEDFKNTLRRFKKACEKEGLMRDIKKYMSYESPGQRKRKAKMRSIKNACKEQSIKSKLL